MRLSFLRILMVVFSLCSRKSGGCFTPRCPYFTLKRTIFYMWQRIQTLWLLLAGIAMTLTLFLPLALLSTHGMMGPENFEMYTLWLKNATDGSIESGHITWDLFVLDALITLISFACIFLFKKRKLQMRLCVFNMLITVGYILDFAVRSWQFKAALDADFSIKFALGLPIITLIFLYLAFRGIRKDEILVRISERIR